MDNFHFFEQIVPIIVFIIWIFSALSGKGKKKGNISKSRNTISEKENSNTIPAKADKPPFSIFEELKRSVSAVIQEALEPEKIEPTERSIPSDTSLQDTNLHANVQPENKYRPAEAVTLSAIRPLQTPKEQPPLSLPVKRGLQVVTSKAKLREGVIWSEILAPPVSLRDNQDR